MRAGRVVLGLDDGSGACDAASQVLLEVQFPAREGEASEEGTHLLDVGPGVDQGTQGHVAGDTREAVEPGGRPVPGTRGSCHGRSRAMAQAAPYPLSIPTTVMPDEQAESIARRAVTPARAAP